MGGLSTGSCVRSLLKSTPIVLVALLALGSSLAASTLHHHADGLGVEAGNEVSSASPCSLCVLGKDRIVAQTALALPVGDQAIESLVLPEASEPPTPEPIESDRPRGPPCSL